MYLATSGGWRLRPPAYQLRAGVIRKEDELVFESGEEAILAHALSKIKFRGPIKVRIDNEIIETKEILNNNSIK